MFFCIADVGQVLSFPGGSILHGGEPIVCGTRYILAVFAYIAGTPVVPVAVAAVGTRRVCPTTDHAHSSSNNGGSSYDLVNAGTTKKARVQAAAGFKDVCWKVATPLNDPSGAATADDKEDQSNSAPSHMFSFNF